MSEASESLALGAMLIRKNLRKVHPDNDALPDGVGRNKGKNAGGHDGVARGEKRIREDNKLWANKKACIAGFSISTHQDTFP